MSLVAFKARNHPLQAVRDVVDDRRTPLDLWDPLNERHRFTVDVAASPANRLCERFYCRDTDGLLRSWSGERVWCNPPFSRLEPWVAKAWREMHSGCELVVMLLPANRCEQRFWQKWIEPFRDREAPIGGVVLRTQFLPGRPRFAAPHARIPKKGDRPPFGCVLLNWTRSAAWGLSAPDFLRGDSRCSWHPGKCEGHASATYHGTAMNLHYCQPSGKGAA